MCKILHRIQQIASNEGITIGAMERTIGASKGVLSRAIANGTDIQSKWLISLVENYPHYSGDWLLTGNGNMLREQPNPLLSTPILQKHITTEKDPDKHIDVFTEASKKTQGAIPLVSEKAVGGFASEHFSIKEKDVLAYYVIPKFRQLGVDFMIEVIGDSMIPRLYPGDIIACSIIHNSKFIQWNKPHLIATREQGLIVKRLRKSMEKDCLLAVSDNHEYDPFDIPKDEIVGIARIVGVIHLE
jgi:phage repressor protein C with HTH and peptisase S24 domain